MITNKLFILLLDLDIAFIDFLEQLLVFKLYLLNVEELGFISLQADRFIIFDDDLFDLLILFGVIS